MVKYDITEDPIYSGLPVQARPGHALRTDILNCLLERFTCMLVGYPRVQMVHLRMRPASPRQSPDSIECHLQTAHNLLTHLEEQHDVGFQFVWACEQSPDSIIPYVRILFLWDARRTRCIAAHLREVDRAWALAMGVPAGQGLVWGGTGNDPASPVHNGATFARGDSDAFRRCFYQASDLAKVNPRCNAVGFTEEFGFSPVLNLEPPLP